MPKADATGARMPVIPNRISAQRTICNDDGGCGTVGQPHFEILDMPVLILALRNVSAIEVTPACSR